MDKYCEDSLGLVNFDEVLGGGKVVSTGMVFSENSSEVETVRTLLEDFPCCCG